MAHSLDLIDISSKIRERVLEIEKCRSTVAIPLNTFNIRCDIDYISDSLFTSITLFVAAEKLKEVSIKTPKTSWEHLKQDYAPKWFLKRFPVKHTTHKYSAKVLYPEYAIQDRHLGLGSIIIREYTP